MTASVIERLGKWVQIVSQASSHQLVIDTVLENPMKVTSTIAKATIASDVFAISPVRIAVVIKDIGKWVHIEISHKAPFNCTYRIEVLNNGKYESIGPFMQDEAGIGFLSDIVGGIDLAQFADKDSNVPIRFTVIDKSALVKVFISENGKPQSPVNSDSSESEASGGSFEVIDDPGQTKPKVPLQAHDLVVVSPSQVPSGQQDFEVIPKSAEKTEEAGKEGITKCMITLAKVFLPSQVIKEIDRFNNKTVVTVTVEGHEFHLIKEWIDEKVPKFLTVLNSPDVKDKMVVAIFAKLIKYIYLDTITFINGPEAMIFHQFAEKLELPKLGIEADQYIYKNLPKYQYEFKLLLKSKFDPKLAEAMYQDLLQYRREHGSTWLDHN